MKELPRLQALILQAAAQLDANVETAPAEWTGAAMNAEVLRPMSGTSPFQRDERDLPKTVGAALLDATPVLMGELPGEAHRGAVDEAPEGIATRQRSRDLGWAPWDPIFRCFSTAQ